jgi:hypothetical protein
MLAAEDAASGLSGMMIPSGQEFFKIAVDGDRGAKVQRYLQTLTQRAHELIFESNFISEFNESLLAMIVFGPCNLFTEWDYVEDGLNYLNFDIGAYTIVRNSRGKIVAVMAKWKLTAEEAVETFGENAGKQAIDAAGREEKKLECFEYIHIVEPRDSFNPKLAGLSLEMPWRSVWVSRKDVVIAKEGGYLHNPYAIADWRRARTEKWGRGRGTMALPAVRQLQQMELDLLESANKHNNPPMEVIESFDGRVDVRPGAQNRVPEMNSIRRLGLEGSFPTAKDEFKRKEEEIEDMFLMKIFRQFVDLSGDRRTTSEIRERKSQALRLVGAPIMNAYNQLIAPSLNRSILLLIRHGKIYFDGSPNPPEELSGVNFGLEFQGELALALRDQQARGFMDWTAFLGNLGSVFPQANVEDYMALQRAIPRMGKSFGINVEDMATEEEIEAKRAARAEQMAQMKAMQAAQMAAEGYGKTTKAPEEGSAAEQVVKNL